jgi:hypothetical protein
MTAITIVTAAIEYRTGATNGYCEARAETALGEGVSATMVPLESGSLADDWTDADLCAAVAKALGVAVEDVSVATPPGTE